MSEWAADQIIEAIEVRSRQAVEAWAQGRLMLPHTTLNANDVLAIIGRLRTAERDLAAEREHKLGQVRITEHAIEEIYQRGYREAETGFWQPVETAPLGKLVLARGPWGHDVLACNSTLRLWYDRAGRLSPTPTAWGLIPGTERL